MSATERARAEEGQDAMTTFDLPALRAAATRYLAHRKSQRSDYVNSLVYFSDLEMLNGFLDSLAQEAPDERRHEPYSDEMREDMTP